MFGEFVYLFFLFMVVVVDVVVVVVIFKTINCFIFVVVVVVVEAKLSLIEGNCKPFWLRINCIQVRDLNMRTVNKPSILFFICITRVQFYTFRSCWFMSCEMIIIIIYYSDVRPCIVADFLIKSFYTISWCKYNYFLNSLLQSQILTSAQAIRDHI